jgi:hypothetical protein
MVRTWARALIGVAAAITLMLALATQIVGAAFGYHPGLGDPIATVFGANLYAPWNVLIWTAQWTLRDLGMAFVHAALVAIALLAAFALAALMSAVEPTSFVIRPPRGRFERWAKLSQCGLLRGDGLALGAVRRLGLGRDYFVRCPHEHALMLGDPAHSDDALIAAVSSWPGALVIVAARDIASRLGRADVMRFAPGRADSIALNPLLGVRGGVHAWSDAMILARAFLRTTDGMLAASFAALVLDTLAHGLPSACSFAGMRQALADPQRRLAELCARWADGASDLRPASGELARVVRHWRRDGEAALKVFRDIDIALRLFADGDHALATEGHQLRLADLVGADGPMTLVVQVPPGREKGASASLASALLAQLVAACAQSPDLDQLGRIKRRELLLVIEADALEVLTAEASSSPPGQLPEKHPPPLMDETLSLAHQRGLRVLVQGRCISNAAALIRADGHSVDNVGVAFPAIAAIGPQTDASASALAERAGSVEYWRRWPGETRTIARWLLPYWERAAEWVVAPDALRSAPASDGLLLIDDLKPIRCRTLICDSGKSSFIAASTLPHAPHDWDVPSLPPAPLGKPAELAALPAVQTEPAANVATPLSGAKLRRALARRSAPGLASPSASSGDRQI